MNQEQRTIDSKFYSYHLLFLLGVVRWQLYFSIHEFQYLLLPRWHVKVNYSQPPYTYRSRPTFKDEWFKIKLKSQMLGFYLGNNCSKDTFTLGKGFIVIWVALEKTWRPLKLWSESMMEKQSAMFICFFLSLIKTESNTECWISEIGELCFYPQ